MEREEKERKRKELLQHGVFVFGAPGTKSNRAYLLSEQDAVLSLWHNSTLDIFFVISKISQKVTGRKISLISPGKIRNEKNRSENEGPIILALQIRQKNILSL